MNEKQDDTPKGSSSPPTPLAEEAIKELRPLIRPGKEDEASDLLEAIFIRETHQGPLPSAREIASYERACPGSAERIIRMAEAEQEHRHILENKVISAEEDLRKRGQLFALAGLIVMLGIVGWFGFIGAPQAGAWLGGAVIVGVVTAFVGPRLLSKPHREENEPDPGITKQTNSKGAVRSIKNRKSRR